MVKTKMALFIQAVDLFNVKGWNLCIVTRTVPLIATSHLSECM